jgi:predicted negative regulator of RcsB-dependent stress response
VPEPEDKRSRREKRRQAQADAESLGAEERAEAEESSEAAGEEASDDGADEAAPAEKPTKKSKKRAEASTTEAIRDRNRRIREQAAQRRRSDRERERGARVASGLDASEMVDDALARSTHAVTGWLKRNFNIIQWVIVGGVAVFVGYQIYSYRRSRSEERASDKLAAGVKAESGRVGGAAPSPELEGVDTRPAFADEQARLQAAEQAYREAATQRPGSGTAILAELGLAGVLYDQGKLDEAKTAYESVKNSELASHDVDVKARAIEGVGNVLEAKKDSDGAQKAFRELENLSVPRLTALGLYHQARIAFAKGETDKAKELLKKVQERLDANKPAPGEPPGYLEMATAELARTIDPKSASALPPGYSLQQIDDLQKQIMKDPTKLEELLKKMGKSFGTPGPSGAPPAPAPPEKAPEGSGGEAP